MRTKSSLSTFVVALFALSTTSIAGADDPATATVFKEQCAVCHAPDGTGQTVMGRKLNVKDWSDGKTLNWMRDADIAKEISVGKQSMPAFTQLADGQVTAMVAFIRTLQK
jgi:mono/diheme cytochrome c family protein